MKYYIGDLHFGHKKVLEFDNRPFETVEEMNETIITNWNNTVTKNDDVYLDSKGIGKVSLLDSGVNVDALVITFNGKIDEIKGKGAGAVENFNYYADGISYYKIMIKHDDTDKALNELGEFGVVRNSVYDINVNKFNNPGYPEIPTPGTDPDEEDGSFLAIQINVNPWTWYTQEEEF